MPDNQQGRTVSDFRVEAQAGTLKKNGTAGEPDPIDKALSDRRKITAANLAHETEASTAAASLRAQNDLLELEKANRDLKAAIDETKATAATQPPNFLQEFLLGELAQAREERALYQREAQAANKEVLDDRVRMLERELAEQRAQPEPPPRADEMESALSTIEKASALMDRIRPPVPAAPPELGYDVNLEKWKLTLQNEREQRAMEREDRRWERELEDRKERERLAREEAIVAKEADSRQRFLDATVPRILDIAEPAIKVFVQRMQVNVSPQAGSPAPAPAPSPQVQGPPPGFQALKCQSCGSPVYYRPDWEGAGCLNCGAWYANDHQPTPEPVGAEANGLANHYEEQIG